MWSSSSGPEEVARGSFVFTIDDGIPELQLGIQLGLVDGPGQQQFPPEYQHHQTSLPPRRQRGPARRQRDRQRAAQHQASKAAASAASHRATTTATAIILPFTGNLLPVNGNKTPSPPVPKDGPHSEAVASAAPPSRTVASVVPPFPPRTAATAAPPVDTAASPSPPNSGPPTATRPIKTAQTSQAASDVKLVKKQLFQAPLRNQASSTIPAPGPKKNYQMQEDDLWT